MLYDKDSHRYAPITMRSSMRARHVEVCRCNEGLSYSGPLCWLFVLRRSV